MKRTEAKDLRAGDRVMVSGVEAVVRRVHKPGRRDWNHVTVYFAGGVKATTVRSDTLLETL
jgi:hypothetical protein